MTPEALTVARGALDTNTRLDAESVRRLTVAASDALDFGHAEAAAIVFQGLRAHADEVQRVAVLTGLARAHESGGNPRAAAEAYLLAAASAKDPRADAAALAARESAAVSLLRAGLRADARAVFEWLARNARAAETRQAAERRLSRL
jgi:hypothetical protein